MTARSLLILLSLAGCTDGRRGELDGGVADGGPLDGAVSDGRTADGSAPDGARDAPTLDAPTADAAACGLGTHFCTDRCAPDDHPDSCGVRCSPCDAPANSSATCAGSCGFECNRGYSLCDGSCVFGDDGCGAIPLPVDCGPGDACGEAGECIDAVCVCSAGYRACAGGCCTMGEGDVQMLEGVAAYGIKTALAPDGTLYIALWDTSYDWRLFESPRGGSIRELTITFEGKAPKAFDMIAIAPRHLVIAAGTGLGGDGMTVELIDVRLDDAAPLTRTALGSGYSGGGVGLTESADGTIWVAWSAERNRDLQVAEVDLAREARRSRVSVTGSLEQVLVEQDPSGGDVYAFWGNRYSGAFRSGAESLTAGDPITPCPADFVAIREDGTTVSLYDTYSSIVSHACIGGTSYRLSTQTHRNTVPSRLNGRGFAMHPDGTLLVSYFDNQRIHWLASVDGTRWARGELSERYREPVGRTNLVWTALAVGATGEVVLASVPFEMDMGPMQVVRFD